MKRLGTSLTLLSSRCPDTCTSVAKEILATCISSRNDNRVGSGSQIVLSSRKLLAETAQNMMSVTNDYPKTADFTIAVTPL